MSSRQTKTSIPEAFSGLFETARYKAYYGGRGSGKSHSLATALLIDGAKRPLRILCAREQCCWVHKTGNVLNKLPKGLQKKAKSHLQDIWMAETRKDAETAFDFFLEAYGPKYDKATACLAKDRDVLLTFGSYTRAARFPSG